MNIIIDIRSLCEQQLTGIGEYALNLTNNLLSQNPQHNFYLFYNSATPVKIPYFENYANARIISFAYPNIGFNLSQKFFHYPQLDKLVEKKANIQADIFFAPNINFINVSAQIKLIVTAHDISFDIFPEFFSAKRRLWHSIINPKKIFRRADQVIAVSKNTKQDLVSQYQLPENKIAVVYSGINEIYRNESTEKGLASVRVKYNLPPKFILYLGTIEPRKNIDSLLTAFQKLKKNSDFDYDLVLAGSRGWKSESIFNKINQPSIHFLDYLAASDKPALYSLAKLLVFPSIYEGFGFPPLEAMACNTPVISSFAASLSEILRSAVYYIDPYDPNSICQAIKTMLTDQSTYQYYQEQGKKLVIEYNWPKTAKQTMEVFEYAN